LTVLVDSWAWIEYFKGSDRAVEVRKLLEDTDEEVIVSAVNISEIYRWILSGYDEKTAMEMNEAIKRRSTIIDLNEEIAVGAARLKHKKKWGLGDSIVYATAIKQKAKIMTGDSDFKGEDGVVFLG
jgi:predicted nucleic acid-binding protein